VDTKVSVGDHIDGNPLNCRRNNLRICTPLQNCFNRKKSNNNKSGYKGVSWNNQNMKWQVYVSINSKNKFVGLYDDLIDAAKAYNEKAIHVYGEFAKLNEIPVQE
jgi:hypothetical protein